MSVPCKMCYRCSFVDLFVFVYIVCPCACANPNKPIRIEKTEAAAEKL